MRFRTHPNQRRCLAHIKKSPALATHMHYLSHIWGLDTERTPRNPRRPLPPFDSAEARGTFKKHHRLKMFKKFTLTDRLLFIAVFLVIIFSKLLYLYDFKLEAIFVGLWAPSILAFGIYLKAIENSKDE